MQNGADLMEAHALEEAPAVAVKPEAAQTVIIHRELYVGRMQRQR